MADIYLARARGVEGFEKLVVAKRLLPRGEIDPSMVSMFLDEARVAATLQHPNIVQVYDIGITDDDNYFFTMEFVYGQDLSHLLRRAAILRRPLSLDAALSIVIGLCAGLHHAHEKEGPDGRPLGLVHRDVSPQNVLISYDGAVKIMDFGIAKATSNSQKTRDGTLKGKIAYMSPEQGSSTDLDRRSDVFSVATMLWELTTFRRLFKAESDFESLRRIIQEDAPRPARYIPTYPAALERIVMKGLRRNPEERYQTAQELQLDLETFAREQRLVISAVSLSSYIRELFQDRVDAWAAAQREGKSFSTFLVEAPDVKEGTAITVDTWCAPATGPTDFGDEDDLPQIQLEVPIAPGGRRKVFAALALVAVCAGALIAWRALSAGDDHAAAQTTPPAAPIAAPSSPAPAAAQPAVREPAVSAPVAVPAPAVAAPTTPAPVAKTVGKPAGTRTPKPVAPKPIKPAVKVDLDSPYPQ
jgi:serine/threonine protein kinase